MNFKFYANFAYLLVILIFPFFHNLLIIRPSLYKIDLKIDNKNSYLVKKVNFDNQLDNYLKKKLTLGDTYLIKYSLNNTFKVTPISTWNLRNFDLTKLSAQIPDLIIKNTEIKEINQNNYALGTINNDYFAQACLLNPKSYFFDKLTSDIPQYSELNYWRKIIIKSLKNNIFFYRPRVEKCLLITLSEFDDFEGSIQKIYKLIEINN